ITPNYQAIGSFSKKGVDLLMSDSTNATRTGFTPSEAAVGAALRHIIKNAKGRVLVASFSCHIHRLQQVCDAAVAVGRKVVVTGRSMVTNTRIARELGYLNVSETDILDAYDAVDLPDDRIVVLCTGSQGEPLSALARMANGEHKSLSITATDTVIISATPVPGNEKSVATILNSLSKIGCDVYDRNNALVHVSGHGCAEELKLIMAMTKPGNFMPIHGEAMHLRAHAQLAEQMGIPRSNIFILDNGASLEMRSGKVRVGENVESGIVYVDGLHVGDGDPNVLRDRKRLAQDGTVTCVAILSFGKKPQVESIIFENRGISDPEDALFGDEAERQIASTLSNKLAEGVRDLDALEKAMRNSLSNYLWKGTRTRPLIVPIAVEV
ncbi:MAG: ribonuclease J, partial [Atopobiaceae bacterium]|nr:ribonuclease J [Atopobiaceae bacterium]